MVGPVRAAVNVATASVSVSLPSRPPASVKGAEDQHADLIICGSGARFPDRGAGQRTTRLAGGCRRAGQWTTRLARGWRRAGQRTTRLAGAAGGPVSGQRGWPEAGAGPVRGRRGWPGPPPGRTASQRQTHLPLFRSFRPDRRPAARHPRPPPRHPGRVNAALVYTRVQQTHIHRGFTATEPALPDRQDSKRRKCRNSGHGSWTPPGQGAGRAPPRPGSQRAHHEADRREAKRAGYSATSPYPCRSPAVRRWPRRLRSV